MNPEHNDCRLVEAAQSGLSLNVGAEIPAWMKDDRCKPRARAFVDLMRNDAILAERANHNYPCVCTEGYRDSSKPGQRCHWRTPTPPYQQAPLRAL